MPDSFATEALLRSRRSIRFYRDEPVDEATVRRILETARYSPTASNSQPVRWIISMTRSKTLEISGTVAESLKRELESDPGNPRNELAHFVVSEWEKGVDVVFRGAPQLAIALVNKSHYFPEDAALALTYFEIASHGLGIGCCWAGIFTLAARRVDEALYEAIGARDDDYVVGAQMFGYPALGPSLILPPRKKPDVSWI
jgi:nitroreductase